jgi:hypothetical protein
MSLAYKLISDTKALTVGTSRGSLFVGGLYTLRTISRTVSMVVETGVPSVSFVQGKVTTSKEPSGSTSHLCPFSDLQKIAAYCQQRVPICICTNDMPYH